MAYVLGQLNDPRAIPMLSEVLEDLEQDPMVRHEVSFDPLPFCSLRTPSRNDLLIDASSAYRIDTLCIFGFT